MTTSTSSLAMMGTAPNMQIEENLALAYRRGHKRGLSWGVTRAERELYRDKLRTLGLGLEGRMSSKVGLLSGGQRQALTLLMAALQKPKLLLLDEHTAALDPATAAKVLELSDRVVAENGLTAMNEDLKRIEQVLEEKVRPQLQSHGGDLEVNRLEDGVLYVNLLGECAGCPSADLTNESVIEAEVVKALPDLVRKVAVIQTVSNELWEQAKQILRDHRL